MTTSALINSYYRSARRVVCLLLLSSSGLALASENCKNQVLIKKTPGLSMMSSYLSEVESPEFSYTWDDLYAELKAAAAKGSEPRYLKEIFRQLDTQFSRFAASQELSRREDLALILTWEALLKYTSELAAKSAHTAVWSQESDAKAAESCAKSAVITLVSETLNAQTLDPQHWGETKDPLWEATLAAARATAQIQGGDARNLADQLCAEILTDFIFNDSNRSYRGHLVYRSAELATLLYLNKYFATIAQATYTKALTLLHTRQISEQTEVLVKTHRPWSELIEHPLANFPLGLQITAPLVAVLHETKIKLRENINSAVLEDTTKEDVRTETIQAPVLLISDKPGDAVENGETAASAKLANKEGQPYRQQETLTTTLYIAAAILGTTALSSGFFLGSLCR